MTWRAQLICATFALVAAGRTPTAIAAEPGAHHELDSWLGDWDVFDSAGHLVGTNRIERVLDGAALIEHWRDADGSEGKSWFYFYPPERRWKQVWVTPGFVKEKAQVEAPAESIRFRGEIHARNGRTLLDQTTLTRQPDGSVRQVIEQSADGGRNWQIGFDAIYRRHKPPHTP